MADLQDLAYCKSQNLSVYFVDNNGVIMARTTAESPNPSYAGNKISDDTIAVTDPSKESTTGSYFIANIQFNMVPLWYSDHRKQQLLFDVGTDL